LPEPPSEPAFHWTALPQPVLERGAPGEWDAVDALNPALVRRDGLYFNFYSGYDGRVWRTGLATSADGIAWRKRGPVLAPDPATWEGESIAANGSALVVNGDFWYWYQAGAAAAHRPGRLARRAALEQTPRARAGARSARRLGRARRWPTPTSSDSEPSFYLFYLGEDRARRQRLGVASSQDGRRWFKLRSNPILELGPEGAFDENGLGEPAVWASHGWYWMLYTGRDRRENRRLGLARSRDGVLWRRVSEGPVFEGPRPWASRVACDPAVEVGPAELRVWFGGGDVAAPAENLNGQIGLAIVRFGP
jgi:predicted GH43/DUF377 family glycosyl hydrolase